MQDRRTGERVTGIPAGLLAAMTSSADSAVDDVLLRGLPGMWASPRTEVGFVAAITLVGFRGIAAAWEPLLKPFGYSLEIQGVFCHAAPVVQFRSPGSYKIGCELADLLVVTDHKDKNGQVTREASLIQAKMASKAKQVSLTGSSSKKQLYLYQNWPSFAFREAVYGNRSYSLASVGNGNSGSFGVIDRHFKNSSGSPPRWTQHDARPTPRSITNEPTFGGFLAQMVAGNGGACGRGADLGGADDWSQIVDLLLTVTYNKAFRHSPTLGKSTSPRGTTAVACAGLGHGPRGRRRRLADFDWRPPFDGIEGTEDGGPGGISVLRLEVLHDG